MYIQNYNEQGQLTNITCDTNNHVIPVSLNNRHYQQLLDDYIEDTSCVESIHGGADAIIVDHAEQRTRNKQLNAYKHAVLRLEQPQLSLVESLTGQIEQTTYDFDNPANTKTTLVDNPMIIQDELERSLAQQTIDNTPDHIKQTQS